MGIRFKRTKLTVKGGAAAVIRQQLTMRAAQASGQPFVLFTEAQVEETLHQFESASSQGEGNG